MMTLLRLIYEFFKTGLFAVGGGLATLPFLYEMGEKTGWFAAEDVLNLLAVSESTPGAIGINMSTYVGFLTAGVPGAIIGWTAVAHPASFPFFRAFVREVPCRACGRRNCTLPRADFHASA